VSLTNVTVKKSSRKSGPSEDPNRKKAERNANRWKTVRDFMVWALRSWLFALRSAQWKSRLPIARRRLRWTVGIGLWADCVQLPWKGGAL